MSTLYRPKMIEHAFLSFMSSRVLPFWSARTPKLRLLNRHVLSEDLVAVQFAVNSNFKRQVFDTNKGWRGGQHISVRMMIDHCYHERRYSIVGLPDETLWWMNPKHNSRTLTLAIKPQGVVSQYLTDTAPIGTIIESSLPLGDFGLNQLADQPHLDGITQHSDPSSPLLCIAGGSGITPMLGIIREALGAGRWVTLLHYQRGLILEAYWQDLADTYPNFRHHLINTQDADTYLAGEKYVSAAGLLSLGLDLTITPIMVCGSAELLAGLYRAIDTISVQAHGDLRDNIIIEHFGVPSQRSSIAINTGKNDKTDTSSSVQTIHLRQRQRQFVSNGILLVAAEDAGVKLPFGCRQGICHLCRCSKISGVVKNLQTNKLSGAGTESIQTCISVAMTDVVLDI